MIYEIAPTNWTFHNTTDEKSFPDGQPWKPKARPYPNELFKLEWTKPEQRHGSFIN